MGLESHVPRFNFQLYKLCVWPWKKSPKLSKARCLVSKMEIVNVTTLIGLLCPQASFWVWPMGEPTNEKKGREEKEGLFLPCGSVAMALHKTLLFFSRSPALQYLLLFPFPVASPSPCPLGRRDGSSSGAASPRIHSTIPCDSPIAPTYFCN